jgi:hypothetical protein
LRLHRQYALTHQTVDEQQWIHVRLTIHYSMQNLQYHNRNM